MEGIERLNDDDAISSFGAVSHTMQTPEEARQAQMKGRLKRKPDLKGARLKDA